MTSTVIHDGDGNNSDVGHVGPTTKGLGRCKPPPCQGRVPNHLFELDPYIPLDISQACPDDFVSQSVLWFTRSTIDSVVLAAIETLHLHNLTKRPTVMREFRDFGADLRGVNLSYSNDSTTYVGQRFFILAVYEYPDYSPVIAHLLRHYLAPPQMKGKISKLASSVMASVLMKLKEILERKTNEDERLEAFFRCGARKLKKLEADGKLKLLKDAIQKRIIDAARFLAYLCLNKMVSQCEFDEIFEKLHNGVSDVYKYEAFCNLMFLSQQDPSKLKPIVKHMKNVLEKYHSGHDENDDHGYGPIVAFELLQGYVRKRREEIARYNTQNCKASGGSTPETESKRKTQDTQESRLGKSVKMNRGIRTI